MGQLLHDLEKDDILLYLTAIIGVIMPGVMYLFYWKAHAYYHKHYGKVCFPYG